ncbi:MAG: glycosyltransferase family 2 protein [Cryobacterium sp.]|nr:glycosyltransferase family 2 protein [Cryobacterium sp.]MBX3104098.1 glycosyltransferase family 2 protein [Cryobacterium sp.]
MANSGGEKPNGRLGVVTVSYGSESVLPAFLASVPAASSQSAVTVIADNLPTSGSVARIAKTAGAIYLAMTRNLGYGGASNQAVAALPKQIEWVLISNPDVTLGTGSIDRLIAVASQDERIAAIGPAVFNEDGSIYPSARAVPSIRTGVGHAMFVNIWPKNPWSRRYRIDSDDDQVARDTGWLSGSCLLVRRSAFDEIGGFDEGYFMYFEDVDLGYRLGKRGYINRYEPTAKVTHSGAHSTTSSISASAKMIAEHHKSAKRFLSKKYSGPVLWPLRIALTTGLNIRSKVLSNRVRKSGGSD